MRRNLGITLCYWTNLESVWYSPHLASMIVIFNRFSLTIGTKKNRRKSHDPLRKGIATTSPGWYDRLIMSHGQLKKIGLIESVIFYVKSYNR